MPSVWDSSLMDIGANQTDEGKGVLFSAVKGQGATSRRLTNASLGQSKSISIRPVPDITKAVFCESVEAGHSSKGDNAAIAEKLGITSKPVQMDSQAKYGSIARGAGDLYLRLPVRKDYQEKIWDHAAGDLIVREAGGVVTDANGKQLDFSKGRTLKDNKGVVAAAEAIHAKVLDVVQEVLGLK
jgi:3'(2'), 5'-bisphosphate nucleotidase